MPYQKRMCLHPGGYTSKVPSQVCRFVSQESRQLDKSQTSAFNCCREYGKIRRE
jgi:hypothetical protein